MRTWWLVLLLAGLLSAQDDRPATKKRAPTAFDVPPPGTWGESGVRARYAESLARAKQALARNPGSTIKLLTTLVAIDLLGPAYTWKTDVFVLGDVENGRLEGDLVLKGYGDPFLVSGACCLGHGDAVGDDRDRLSSTALAQEAGHAFADGNVA